MTIHDKIVGDSFSPDSEHEDYRESEDEDYSPQADKATESSSDEEDGRELDSAYAQYQGRGGLIKTRAQRKAEAEGRMKPEPNKKAATVSGSTSVDIDALWKEMNEGNGKSKAKSPASAATVANTMDKSESANPPSGTTSPTDPSSKQSSESTTLSEPRTLSDEYITITRTFKFAGDVKTETKNVLKHSAEGQDYLNQQKLKSQGRGPAKRKMSLMEEYTQNKAKKINTLEKSRLDWLGFVDKEGIKDDLTKFNKAGYLDRQSFLARVDSKIDSNIRQQRAKNMQH